MKKYSLHSSARRSGALGGSVIHDDRAFGLDSAVPAFFVCLLLDRMPRGRARVDALIAAALAVALTPVLPGGVAAPDHPADCDRSGGQIVRWELIGLLGATCFALRPLGPFIQRWRLLPAALAVELFTSHRHPTADARAAGVAAAAAFFIARRSLGVSLLLAAAVTAGARLTTGA